MTCPCTDWEIFDARASIAGHHPDCPERGRDMKATAVKPKLTEAEFTKQVIEFAQLMGWKAAHFRPAMTSKGWRTPVQGDGAGFPDLVLVRGRECYVWELKVKPNRASTAQAEWIEALQDAGLEAQVLYPEQWDWIQAALMRK